MPSPGRRDLGALWVWLRNAHIWTKSWKTSLVGSIGEPLFYLLGLGYGLGALIPPVEGSPYVKFVAPGLMLSSAMYSTTIEATYMTYTKMEHQRVFASMVLSPLGFGDIVVGEILWAATKGFISGGTVLLLSLLLGLAAPWPGVLGIFLLLTAGVIFASMGLLAASVARGYDSFNYYFTLIISPMFFFSGIFFPVRLLGRWVEAVAWFFPLSHLVKVSRALFAGHWPEGLGAEVAWVGSFALLMLILALNRMSRRFMP